MTTREELHADVARRLAKAQALMDEHELGAIIIPAHGAPDRFGLGRYFTNAVTWAGTAWVVIGAGAPEPALVSGSPYSGEWNRQEATTSWVETPEQDALGRALEIARGFTRARRRVGVAHTRRQWFLGAWEAAQSVLADCQFVDLSAPLDALRVIKSPFELEAVRETGAVMAAAFEAFSAAARPGVSAWAAAGEAERAARAGGCFWSRMKYSFDLRPYTFPPRLERRLEPDDVFVFELVASGPLGYWCEQAALFSFGPLPDPQAAQLEAHTEVIRCAAAAAIPGTPIGALAGVVAEAWRDLGWQPEGKHTPDCHSIGLDNVDGPSSEGTPDALLAADMVLSFHPSTMVSGGKAFLLSDNYQVTPGGAVRLSPRGWHYRRLTD